MRCGRRGWASIAQGQNTLIAAPTGSGKTLAAFLIAIDALLREGLDRPLADEVKVLYVSPLKALSTDIHRNLERPRRGICDLANARGLAAPEITAAVRTGDTPAADRAAMLKRPPHILVTTPESLYLLLTSERSRRIFSATTIDVTSAISATPAAARAATPAGWVSSSTPQQSTRTYVGSALVEDRLVLGLVVVGLLLAGHGLDGHLQAAGGRVPQVDDPVPGDPGLAQGAAHGGDAGAARPRHVQRELTAAQGRPNSASPYPPPTR